MYDALTNVLILFLDLEKAFDATDHEIPLSKLNLYGFKGAGLHVFSNYVSNKTKVKVSNRHITFSKILQSKYHPRTIIVSLVSKRRHRDFLQNQDVAKHCHESNISPLSYYKN